MRRLKTPGNPGGFSLKYAILWQLFSLSLSERILSSHVKRITSVHNPVFAWARRLVDRPESGEDGSLTVFLEGEKLVNEALRSGARLRGLFVVEGRENDWHAHEALVHVLTPDLMKRLSGIESHAPVAAAVAMPAVQPLSETLSFAKTVVILDRVQDPGNVGTIIRSCEALGADALILLRGSCSRGNMKVLRAAMGSAFRLPVHLAVDPADLLAELGRASFVPLATAMDGRPIWEKPLPTKAALFFGAEGTGLDSVLTAGCHETIRIPMQGPVESLNVAASVAICLYERFRSASDIAQSTSQTRYIKETS